jgi:hypothetical protein
MEWLVSVMSVAYSSYEVDGRRVHRAPLILGRGWPQESQINRVEIMPLSFHESMMFMESPPNS